MKRPGPKEYAPFYNNIIDPVEGEDVVIAMKERLKIEKEFLLNIDEQIGNYRYAEGKWTIKEVIQHVIDTERIMNYRALRIVRGDKLILPGYDENAYVAGLDLSERKLSDLIEEYLAVRKSTIYLFNGVTEEQSKLIGNANGYEISVRAIAYVLVGHAQHHFMMLKKRYL